MKLSKCLNCTKEFRYGPHQKTGKYCSNKCFQEHRFETKTLVRFYEGQIKERSTLRNILTETVGYKCSVCSITNWNNKPITLQVDHIDGNAGNNMPKNLRLICPNCHSQTDTFGGKNKGNGRAARGLSLK